MPIANALNGQSESDKGQGQRAKVKGQRDSIKFNKTAAFSKETMQQTDECIRRALTGNKVIRLKGRRPLDPQSLVGRCIADRYELLALAGRGGMGTVFKARQADLDRLVAVKILDPGFLHDDDSVKRFEREARSLSRLSHAHIAGFYAYGDLDNSIPYIVMEYLDGQSLVQSLESGLALDRAMKISLQIADAMDYAHKEGIIHRDLKPANILLQNKPDPDFVKVLDFGLSFMDGSPETTGQKLTNTGCVLGTPQYLSPEQCQGRRADARSDIYALGCIIYEMLCGQTPFVSENPLGLIHMHVSEMPLSLSKRCKRKLPAGLDHLVLTCLAKDPERRYQSMQDLQSDLKRISQGMLPEFHFQSERKYQIKLPKSRGFWLVLGSSALLTVLSFVVWFFSDAGLSSRCRIAMLRYHSSDELMALLSEAKQLRDQGKTKLAGELIRTVEVGMRLDSMRPLAAAKICNQLAEKLLNKNDLSGAVRFALEAQDDLRLAHKQRDISGFAGDMIDATAGDFKRLKLKIQEEDIAQIDAIDGKVDKNSLEALIQALLALNMLALDRIDLAKPHMEKVVEAVLPLRQSGHLDESLKAAALLLFDAYDTDWVISIPYITRMKGSHECQLAAIKLCEAAFPDKMEFHRGYVFARSFIGLSLLEGAEQQLKKLLLMCPKDSGDYQKTIFDLAAVQEALGRPQMKLKLAEDLKDHYSEIEICIKIARGQIWAGNYKAAHETLDGAMTKIDKNSPSGDEIEIYRTQAGAYGDAGEYAKAVPYLRHSLDLILAAGGGDARLYQVTKDLDHCLRKLNLSNEADNVKNKFSLTSKGEWYLSKRAKSK